MLSAVKLRNCDRYTVGTEWWPASVSVNDPKFLVTHCRMHYVHSGSPTIYCNEKSYKLEPGKLYFFPQNLSFRAEMEEGTVYDHTALDFFVYPPTRMANALVLDPAESPILKSATDILLQVAVEYTMKRYDDRHEFVPLIESYCLNLLKLIDARITPIQTVSAPFIADILSYIHDNFQRDLTVDELATRTNYQLHVFIRKFKQVMGVTPYKYIKDYRLNTAYYLLRAGDFMVSEVATQVGYSDTSSFSGAFKQHFGISPNEVAQTVSL